MSDPGPLFPGSDPRSDEPGAANADEGGEGPGDPGDGDHFGQELAASFRRHRPQGSLKWNFDVAFALLEEEFGAGEPDPLAPPGITEAAAAGTPPPGTPELAGGSPGSEVPSGSGLRLTADRLVLSRLRRWVDRRAAAVAADVTARTLREGLGRTGVAQSVEALRFLALRVEALESSAGLRRAPVAAPESMLPPLSMQEWLQPVTDLARAAAPGGDVLHGECGDGRLVESLCSAGLAALGVEPRGSLAWDASRRRVPVRLAGVGAHLAATDPGALGGIVLSGIVDRSPVEDLVALLGTAVDRLAPGGILVVIGSGPDEAVSGWPAVARDLLPGRPLHPETWGFLMVRAGLSGVGAVAPDSATTGYAVAGRRDR